MEGGRIYPPWRRHWSDMGTPTLARTKNDVGTRCARAYRITTRPSVYYPYGDGHNASWHKADDTGGENLPTNYPYASCSLRCCDRIDSRKTRLARATATKWNVVLERRLAGRTSRTFSVWCKRLNVYARWRSSAKRASAGACRRRPALARAPRGRRSIRLADESTNNDVPGTAIGNQWQLVP